MATAVKICGITRSEDALAAARAGSHAVGLMFYRRSARCVTAEQALRIVRALPPFVTPVGVFVDPSAAEVRKITARVPLALLQFHGEEPRDFCGQFGLPYVKALRVKAGVDLLQYARAYQDARGLLLDAFVEGSRGGSGIAFDWGLVPPRLPLPVILSGGLNAANVAAAVRRVRPWAVDVSSGVEAAKGVKDAAKIAAFIAEVRNADV